MDLYVHVVHNCFYGDKHPNLSKCRIKGKLKKMVSIIVWLLLALQ